MRSLIVRVKYLLLGYNGESDVNEFSRRRYTRHLDMFPPSNQTIIKCLEEGIVTHGTDGGHCIIFCVNGMEERS